MQKILVTGGAGYIGSHTVVKLISAGFMPVILDNWSNANPAVIDRLVEITGQSILVEEGDLLDDSCLSKIFSQHEFSAVVHFAALKAVGESCEQPLRYYENNVVGAIKLIKHMQAVGCHRLVFSSSATVYGDPDTVPIAEDAAVKPTNPYGESKLIVENVMRDLCAADPTWSATVLRYFNPVGAHPSGLIGEDPADIPNNLVPYIAQVAVGKLAQLSVFGDDYDTPDGTGVRDYIHVEDLAEAHVKALTELSQRSGCAYYNLGTGRGYSVLEMIAAFEKASGRQIPYAVNARREGDIATCFADPTHSEKELGWRAQLGLDEMMVDHWRWQQNNPDGFESND
ncbi:MAG: UDP-glucose 4-epimerase GalE [Pseudomonadota bacterium]